jgi:5'(3')-deoxyribonucleotidase
MDKLSTELASKIAKCLAGDQKALSALSQTNKYYRMVAEPYLYRDLVFHPDKGVPLKRLLLVRNFYVRTACETYTNFVHQR